MSHQFTWESRRASYQRRVNNMTKQMKFIWYTQEREDFLDRLCHIVGDPVNGHELRVMVAAYNRELLGRRSAKAHKELHAPVQA